MISRRPIVQQVVKENLNENVCICLRVKIIITFVVVILSFNVE